MTAYNNITNAIAGLKHGLDSRVESHRCAEALGIGFGLPVFSYAGEDKNIFTQAQNVGVITWDADFVASNSILVTIDGVAGTPVVYATSHAATLAAVAAGIEADFAGATAVVGTRLITVTIEDGTERVVLAAVTLGASQAGSTYTYSTSQIFVGISMFTQKEAVGRTDLAGTVIEAASTKYVLNEPVNVMVDGWIYVVTADAVGANKQAYAIVAAGATKGQVSDTVGSNIILTGVFFKSTVAAAGLALVRVNK